MVISLSSEDTSIAAIRRASISPSMSALPMEMESTLGFMARRDLALIFKSRKPAERKAPSSAVIVTLRAVKPFIGFPVIDSTESSEPSISFTIFPASRTTRSPAKSAPARAKKEKTIAMTRIGTRAVFHFAMVINSPLLPCRKRLYQHLFLHSAALRKLWPTICRKIQ